MSWRAGVWWKKADSSRRATQKRLGEFMAYRFDEYIPLKHHLMMYQEHNIIMQYSELNPESA